MIDVPSGLSELGGFLPNFNINWGQIIQLILAIVLLFFFIIAIYLLRKKSPIKRFPTVVLIHEILKDEKTVPILTAGRRVGKLSEFQEYELKNGDMTQPFSLRDLQALPNGKKFLELDKLEDGRYIPHRDVFKETKNENLKVMVDDPDNPGKQIEGNLEHAINLYDFELTQNDINHTIDQIRRDIEKFSLPGFWNKYGKEFLLIIFMFTMSMGIYIYGQQVLVPMIDRGTSISQQNAQATADFKNVTYQIMESMERQNIQNQYILILMARLLNVSIPGNGTVIT